MKKKILSLAVCLALSSSLLGCGGSSPSSENSTLSAEEVSAGAEADTSESTVSEAATDDTADSIAENEAAGTTDTAAESSEAVSETDAVETAEAAEGAVYGLGDTWTVDGQWSVTVTAVEETDERNQYSDLTPSAVYVIDYIYTNIGYEETIMDGLYIRFDDTIVDANGTMGYSYPGNIVNYPQETPIGATCKAQAVIGVDNPGPFTVNQTVYDSDMNQHTASFSLDPEADAVDSEPYITGSGVDTSTALKVGDTWTVDGQWEFTITGVQATDERNTYSDYNPEAVYFIDYTYTNLGYEDATGIMDGLYINIDDGIVDAQNLMGYTYPGDTASYPQKTPVDASCSAQACIGVDHAGPFTFILSIYDGNSVKQQQTFYIEP